MRRTFRVICEGKPFCVCSTEEQAACRAERLRSRGHVTWVEPVDTEPGSANGMPASAIAG